MPEDLYKPDPESRVAVYVVYYHTKEDREKLDKILGMGKPDGVVSRINNEIGEITCPYDGKETKDLWKTISNEEKEPTKRLRKKT